MPYNVEEIEILLSPARIQKYKKSFSNWVEGYENDIEIARHLYKSLHFLEVFIRNRIDRELSKVFTEDWIFGITDFPFSERSLSQLSEIKYKKRDAIISNISFGFWTGLFHSSYHHPLWIKKSLVAKTFPYFKTEERGLKQIELELDKIRRLRNRIFHFEPLFQMNLIEDEALLLKYIKGISGFGFEKNIKNSPN